MSYLYICPTVRMTVRLILSNRSYLPYRGRKTDLGRLCWSDLVDSEKRAGRDLSELMFTLTGGGATMTSAKEQDTSYLTTFLGDTSLIGKASSEDKDLSPYLESTGLQGLFNGEDLAYFFAMETMIP